jgi:hypothetical protein
MPSLDSSQQLYALLSVVKYSPLRFGDGAAYEPQMPKTPRGAPQEGHPKAEGAVQVGRLL